MPEPWWPFGWFGACMAQRSGCPRPWGYPRVTSPPPQFGVSAIPVSQRAPSPSLGWVLAARTGWEEMTDKVLFSIRLSRELGREQDKGDPDGFPTGPDGGAPPHGTTWGRVTPWLGCPGPSLSPGEMESRHGPGTGLSASGHRRGRHRRAAGWLGGLSGTWCRGRGKGEGIFAPCCWYPSPPADTPPWRWATAAGPAQGTGTSCPVPSSVRGRGLQQAARTTL